MLRNYQENVAQAGLRGRDFLLKGPTSLDQALWYVERALRKGDLIFNFLKKSFKMALWSIDFKQDAKQLALDKKNVALPLYPKGFAPATTSSSSSKNTTKTSVLSKKDKAENNALKLKKAWEV
jgi:hypothetical protein